MKRVLPDIITVLGLAAVITPFLALYPERQLPLPRPAEPRLAPTWHLAAKAGLRDAESDDPPGLGDLTIPGAFAEAQARRAETASTEKESRP